MTKGRTLTRSVISEEPSTGSLSAWWPGLFIPHCPTHSAKAWRLFSNSCGYFLSTSFGGGEEKEAKRVMSELHVTRLCFKRLIGGEDTCQLNNYLQFMTLRSQSAYCSFILFIIHVCEGGLCVNASSHGHTCRWISEDNFQVCVFSWNP